MNVHMGENASQFSLTVYTYVHFGNRLLWIF